MATTETDRSSDAACAVARDTDRLERYALGALPAAEAEAYEEHYFACDECWSLVQTALAVRTALASPPPVAAPARRPTVWAWLVPAGVAAAIAVVALVRVWPSAPGGGAFRGADHVIPVTAAASSQGLHVVWARSPEADVYVLRVQRADGDLLAERQVRDTTLDLEWSRLTRGQGGGVYVRVEALDAVRRTVGRSRVTRVDSVP